MSIEDLKATVASLSPERYSDYPARAFGLSAAIIRKCLGQEWINNYVSPTSKRAAFYRLSDVQAHRDITRSEFRVLDLAELAIQPASHRWF